MFDNLLLILLVGVPVTAITWTIVGLGVAWIIGAAARLGGDRPGQRAP